MQVIETLRERGIGVLITDHNVRETLSICQKAYIVSEGKVIAQGNKDEILFNELVRKVYLGQDFVVSIYKIKIILLYYNKTAPR